MKRLDRRTFVLVASVGSTGAILTACGNDPAEVDLDPTMIPVDGAPPTLAPFATPGGGAGEATPVEDGADAGASGDVIELEAIDPFDWSVHELNVAPGQVIRVTNTGVLEHDFTVDELEIHEVLPNGEPVDITIPESAPIGDTYEFYCSVPGHREGGMEGTLTIVEASAGGGEGEEGEEEAAAAGGEEAASGEPIELEAIDPFEWSVNELTVAPGQVIRATNTGVLEHDFTVDELGINENLPSGEPVEITIPDDAPVGDTYEFYCSIPGHREGGMEGTLTIAGADEAAGDEQAEEGDGEAVAAAGDGAATGEPIELEAVDPFAWSVYEIDAAPGQVIRVTNTGVLQHDFTVDELSIQEDLPRGEPVDITIPADAAVGETYEFYCSVPGHREGGMEGTLTIVEASAGGGEGTGEGEDGEEAGAATAQTASSEPILLEALDPYQWSIGELVVSPGQVIQVVNAGLLEHDFVVDELGLEVPLPIGEPVDVTIPDDATIGDTYEFYCSIPGHREMGMAGDLTIAEAAADTGPEAQGGPSEEVEAEPAEVDDEIARLLEDPDVIALEATDPYNWSWKAIEAMPGQIIRVINRGVLEHDFVIDELDIKQLLPFSEPIDIQVPESVEIGDSYIYYCSIPGHRERGMEGILTIVEEAATPVASPEATPVASSEATPAASPAASPVAGQDAAGASDVQVITVELAFEPNEFEIPANTDVAITITNEGVLPHDFAVEELGIASALLQSGESDTVTINAEPGTYEFICTEPGHAQGGMVGTLTVV